MRRYYIDTCFCACGADASADENPTGEWVKADDAIALEKERDELRAALTAVLPVMERIKNSEI